jgi:NAD-dependent dihydropyrimidine dehydrogenase PreA subunit
MTEKQRIKITEEMIDCLKISKQATEKGLPDKAEKWASMCYSMERTLKILGYNVEIDEEKCTGCGLCIPACPGMAIFVVDEHYTDTEALVSFPHEFLPMPVKGQAVKATDRKGSVVCDGEIMKVVMSGKFDHTAVVTVKIPCEFASTVRGIQRLKKGE